MTIYQELLNPRVRYIGRTDNLLGTRSTLNPILINGHLVQAVLGDIISDPYTDYIYNGEMWINIISGITGTLDEIQESFDNLISDDICTDISLVDYLLEEGV